MHACVYCKHMVITCCQLTSFIFTIQAKQLAEATAKGDEGIPELISIMRRNKKDTEIQTLGCKFLQNVFLNTVSRRKLVMDSGGLQRMCKAIRAHRNVLEVVLEACGTVELLVSKETLRKDKLMPLMDIEAVLLAMESLQDNVSIQIKCSSILSNLTPECCKKFRAGRILATVLSVMDKMKTEADVQMNCSMVMFNLATKSMNCIAIKDGGGIRFALSAMRQHALNEKIVEKCLCLLGKLASHADITVTIREEGGIKDIVDVIQDNSKRHRFSILKHAFAALAKIAAGNADNCASIRQEGGIQAIIGVLNLKFSAANLTECMFSICATEACDALKNLAVGDTENKIGKEGGIKAVLRAILSAVPSNTGLPSSTLESTCAALLALCINNQDNTAAVCKEGGIKTIISVMNNLQDCRLDFQRLVPQVENSVCALLSHLSASGYKKALREEGGIKWILNVMKKGSYHSKFLQNACLALQNLRSDADSLIEIRQLGGITCILQGMCKFEENAGVQEQGCAALAALAVNDDYKVDIQKASGVKVTVTAMQKHPIHAGIQGGACSLLAVLAAHEGCRMYILQEQGIIKALVSALKNHQINVVVQQQACSVLRYLAVSSENKDAIRQEEGIEAILCAMNKNIGSDVIQERACRILWKLVHENEKNQAAVKQAGGMKIISKAMDVCPNNLDVQEISKGLLQILGSKKESSSKPGASKTQKSKKLM
jgi:hypothetical protein